MPISLLEQVHEYSEGAKIKVIGVGGGGGNILNSMISNGISDVDFVAINTDVQALNANLADIKVQIGKNLTNGLGTGMNKEKGEKAAEENNEEIERVLRGSDMVFITAGMGGGTGTGAAPVVAKIAKNLGALVVAIVTKPFNFEGPARMSYAHEGLEKLKKEVDSMILIPNQRILQLINRDTSRKEAFEIVNRVLHNATKGISQIITKTGEVNVDFADVKTTMSEKGDAMIGLGIASGENRAEAAAAAALSNPILEDVNIKGAKSVLVNILSNGDITMTEMEKIFNIIREEAGTEANVICGWADDSTLKDDVVVTLIATGFKINSDRIVSNSSSPFDEDNFVKEGFIQQPIKKPIDVTSNTKKEKHVPLIKTMLDENQLENMENIPSYKRRYNIINPDLSEKEEIQKTTDSSEINLDGFIDDDDTAYQNFLKKQSR